MAANGIPEVTKKNKNKLEDAVGLFYFDNNQKVIK